MPSVETSRKARGITKKDLESALRVQMREDEIDVRGLRMLGNGRQMDLVKKVLKRISGKKANSGKHAIGEEGFKRKLQGKGLEDEHVDGIAAIAASCNDKDAKRVFDAALPDLRFDDLNADEKTAFYFSVTRGITINIEASAAGFSSRPDKDRYQTFFHEYGHYIDHRYGGDGAWASWKARLGETAAKEVNDKLNSIMEEKGHDSVTDAKRDLTEEIVELFIKDPSKIGGLSDIVNGATSGTCCDYGLPKHSSETWNGDQGPHALATETFAHFFECTMANEGALETLKSYLPETYHVFNDMLKGFR